MMFLGLLAIMILVGVDPFTAFLISLALTWVIEADKNKETKAVEPHNCHHSCVDDEDDFEFEEEDEKEEMYG